MPPVVQESRRKKRASKKQGGGRPSSASPDFSSKPGVTFAPPQAPASAVPPPAPASVPSTAGKMAGSKTMERAASFKAGLKALSAVNARADAERKKNAGLSVLELEPTDGGHTKSSRRKSTAGAAGADRAKFPAQEHAWIKVTDPRVNSRFQWDCFLMLLIFYVMLVTPFQLSFTEQPSIGKQLTSGSPAGHNKYVVLFCINTLVDVFFVADLLLCFNTGFYSAEESKWIINRKRIAVYYSKSWFCMDFVSSVPYQLVYADSSYLKMVKMVRLLKMLRVLKQPRIMARIAQHNTMRAGQQAVFKYVLILWFLLHWTACAIRMIAGLTVDGCRPTMDLIIDSEPCGTTVLAKYWNRGIWAQYVNALTWALGTLQGDFVTTNVAEEVCCLVVGLIGCIVMAFLVGDLCNVVSNMDPVGNDYSLTLDSLNSWLEENAMPYALRLKLREYMGLAEKTFRDEHNKAILNRLSPSLKAVVAHYSLAREVSNISFYAQCVVRTYRLYRGQRVAVYAVSRDKAPVARPCVILGVSKCLHLTVRYDNSTVEQQVSYKRIDVNGYDLGGDFEREITRFSYQHDNFVLGLSHMLKTKFFMARDVLVQANMTLNDEMFLLMTGRAVVWGEKSVNPLCSFAVRNVLDSIGDDICMLTVSHRKAMPRLYTVRATSTTEVLSIMGAEFATFVGTGSYSAFEAHVHAYGVWQLLRYKLISRVREHQLSRDTGATFAEGVPGADAALLAAAAARVVGKLASVVLAADDEARERFAGTGGPVALEALEALERVLDDPTAAAADAARDAARRKAAFSRADDGSGRPLDTLDTIAQPAYSRASTGDIYASACGGGSHGLFF